MPPILSKPWIIVTVLVYTAVTLGIGFWALRRTRNAKDFFIAGQDLGLWVTGLATMAAAFSGFVFLGGPGLTYRIGVASLLINVPVAFTAVMLCWVLAKRLRLLAEVREIFTIPDALGARFDSRAVSGLAALAVLFGSVSYLAAQVLALGVLIENLFATRGVLGDWSLAAAMAIGLTILVSYCVAGGMVAGVYTDVFQGSVKVVAAVAVFIQCLRVGGGLDRMTHDIAAAPAFGPAFLDPLGRVPAATAVGFFFVFGIGVLGQPHMLHKFFMLRDPRKLRYFPHVLGVSQTLCLLIWLGIGLTVPALVAQGRLDALARPDDAAPLFLLKFCPDPLAGLVLAGILAAIMSTASSFINLAAAALVRDLPRACGRQGRDELRAGRWATAGIGVAAGLLACVHGDLIALLGTFAFGTFAAALAPALAIGLNWKRVSAAAAGASIATGMGLNLTLEYLSKSGALPHFLAPGVLPSAVALAASFVVLFLVSWLRPARRGELEEDVSALMEM